MTYTITVAHIIMTFLGLGLHPNVPYSSFINNPWTIPCNSTRTII